MEAAPSPAGPASLATWVPGQATTHPQCLPAMLIPVLEPHLQWPFTSIV